MTVRVIVSRNPQNRMYRIPEDIDVIDVTHCLTAISHLLLVAHDVRDKSLTGDPFALTMVQLVLMIEQAISPPGVTDSIVEDLRRTQREALIKAMDTLAKDVLGRLDGKVKDG